MEQRLLGKNIEDVQKSNQASVLQTLRQHQGTLSRRQISDIVGLTPGTVTNIVRDLMDAGYVIETGFLAGKKGRRAVALNINPKGFYVLGVRLSRSRIVCRVFNPLAEVLLSKTVTIENFDQSTVVLEQMMELMEEVIEKSGIGDKLQAIGVSTPGPIDFKEGKIAYIHGNDHWRDVPIQQLVYERFGVTTIIEHDANAAALAEFMFGDNNGINNLFYVAVGSGIGAGTILNGRLLRGSFGSAGLFGHVSVDHNGPKCSCGGSGCLTNYSSSKAFLKRMRHLGIGEGVSIGEYMDLVNSGNEIVQEEVKKAAELVGVAVAGVVNLINPELVVFGDEMTWFGSLWLDTAKETVHARLAPQISKNLQIVQSSFGQESFLLGTGAIAIEHVFQNPVMEGRHEEAY